MTKSKKSSSLMSYAGTFGALVILCVVLAIAPPNFFKYSNMMSVLKQTSFNALVSPGMLLCLITAGIDLSVGANATFAACLAGMLVNKGMNNPVLLLVVAIVGGTLIGWINGKTDTKTDGNKSPKTFDAGIAMYVGMALTSVAGSAVVIGKKKEF